MTSRWVLTSAARGLAKTPRSPRFEGEAMEKNSVAGVGSTAVPAICRPPASLSATTVDVQTNFRGGVSKTRASSANRGPKPDDTPSPNRGVNEVPGIPRSAPWLAERAAPRRAASCLRPDPAPIDVLTARPDAGPRAGGLWRLTCATRDVCCSCGRRLTARCATGGMQPPWLANRAGTAMAFTQDVFLHVGTRASSASSRQLTASTTPKASKPKVTSH